MKDSLSRLKWSLFSLIAYHLQVQFKKNIYVLLRFKVQQAHFFFTIEHMARYATVHHSENTVLLSISA